MMKKNKYMYEVPEEIINKYLLFVGREALSNNTYLYKSTKEKAKKTINEILCQAIFNNQIAEQGNELIVKSPTMTFVIDKTKRYIKELEIHSNVIYMYC